MVKKRNGEYYPAARKVCKSCCGEYGHKPCRSCKADKPIEDFYWAKSGNSDTRRPMPDCKICWRQVKNLREKGHKIPPKKKPGPAKMSSYGKKPPGWTPAPTAEKLAEIHRRYSPPRQWLEHQAYWRGEQSA